MSHSICHKFSARSMGPTEQSACVVGEIDMLIGDDACDFAPNRGWQCSTFAVHGTDSVANYMSHTVYVTTASDWG